MRLQDKIKSDPSLSGIYLDCSDLVRVQLYSSEKVKRYVDGNDEI